MHIICLKPLEPGVYNDHKADHITTPPEGWAYIPEDIPLPSTFPRLGSLEAEELTYTREVEKTREVTKTREVEIPGQDGQAITVTEEYKETETYTEEVPYTMMTVTEMTEGTLPDPEPAPPPTTEERVAELEAALAQTDETAIELYEAQAEQEAINAAQDEALIEIYEMMEG